MDFYKCDLNRISPHMNVAFMLFFGIYVIYCEIWSDFNWICTKIIFVLTTKRTSPVTYTDGPLQKKKKNIYFFSNFLYVAQWERTQAQNEFWTVYTDTQQARQKSVGGEVNTIQLKARNEAQRPTWLDSTHNWNNGQEEKTGTTTNWPNMRGKRTQ